MLAVLDNGGQGSFLSDKENWVKMRGLAFYKRRIR